MPCGSKMTDKEIEKALEVCGLSDLDCKDCPYFNNIATCLRLKDRDAYEYIQRLKAEKEQIRKDTAKNFAETLIALLFEENKGETITIKDLHTVIKDVAKAQYGVEVDE